MTAVRSDGVSGTTGVDHRRAFEAALEGERTGDFVTQDR
jgi:hypothetical protein